MRLERHDLRRGVRQKLAVMTDVEEGLAAGRHRRLEPLLAEDVEEVVWLIQEQNLRVRTKQRLEQDAFQLAAGQRVRDARTDRVERFAGCGHAGGAPADFQLVATELAPLMDGIGVGDAGCLGGAGLHGALGLHQRGAGPRQLDRGLGDE